MEGQTFDAGLLRDMERRDEQLLGKWRGDQSFAVRNIAFGMSNDTSRASFKKPVVAILPFSWLIQFNSRHPYGGNDGSLIAAKGLQSRLSGGVQVRAGFVEMQLAPELVWAANTLYPSTAQFGFNNGKSFQRMYVGQTTLKLVAGTFAVGVSTANQWWGPGVRNSLLMSYQAPGFAHVFVGSRKPLRTAIGSFEWKLMGGWLDADSTRSMENFHLTSGAGLGRRKRYLSSLVLSYQPKWLPGLFLGVTRSVQTYATDSAFGSLGFLERYVPVLALAAQKKNVQNEDFLERDQLASFFLRWVFPQHQFEWYAEYGINDYGINTRDYLLGPSHSAAHIIGIKKIIPQNHECWIDINLEFTKMSQSPDWMVRDAGNWYIHSSIREGYTHENQILGSVYGFGADAIYAGLRLVKGRQKWGFYIEQIDRDPINKINKWVDRSLGVSRQVVKGKLLIQGKLSFIHSQHYAWEKSSFLQVQGQMVIGVSR